MGMSKENSEEKLSRLFDGDLGGDVSHDINREKWNVYAIIGDVLRDGPDNLSRDVSTKVRRSLEDNTQTEPVKKGFWTSLLNTSILQYLSTRWLVPKTGAYQFASVAIVFALGFSSHDIMTDFQRENIENFYVESGVRSIAVLNPSEQIESDCDISEVFIDELIMHHERLSGSSDLC